MNWYKLSTGILLAIILLILFIKKPIIPPSPEIEFWRHKADSITIVKNHKIDSLTNNQTKIYINTKQSNEKASKNIKNIPTYNDAQRDSFWANYNTSEDSIYYRKLQGYWDILYQRARVADSTIIKVEGSLPK